MSAKTKWELSARHDWAAYARAYAPHRRIHIPDIMARSDAEAACRALAETTNWKTVINAGSKIFDLSAEIKASLTLEQSGALERSIAASASRCYQFKFDNYRLSEQGEPHGDRNHPLAPIVAFINGPRFLAAMRRLTGRPDIAFADAQATAISPANSCTFTTISIRRKGASQLTS